jgi:hypothetical protein
MTSARDDLQARASDTLMQALGVDRRNSDILVSDKNQCRNPNPVDLVVYSFVGDDASGRLCHTKSMISAHTMSPLAALLNARRVGEKRPPEHDVQQVLSKNAAIACSCPIPEHSRINASLVVSICPLISAMLGYQPAPRIRPYYAL